MATAAITTASVNLPRDNASIHTCNCGEATLGIKYAPSDNEDDAKETVAEGEKAAEHEGKDAVRELRRKTQRRKRDVLHSLPLRLPKVQVAAPRSSLPSESAVRKPRDRSVHPRLGRQRKGSSKLVTFGDRELTAVLSLTLLDSPSTHTAAQ